MNAEFHNVANNKEELESVAITLSCFVVWGKMKNQEF